MGKDQDLLEAARNGNVAVVEKILGQRAKRSGPLASLRRGPGANVQDSSGYSALHHSALNGHKDVVKLLLQYEASTNIVDAKGSSPLHLAAWSGNSEIVRLILSQGPSLPNANLTTKDNETALHCAAQYGHTEVVAQLLQYGCDPSIRNTRGESALDLAAQYGRLETVELLVRTHPELIEVLRSSLSSLIFPHTPLHLASRNGHRACVEVLLAAGVYVNAKTSAGTAMHEAALCGKMEVVRTLLHRGIDLTIKDSRDNTVLDLLGQFPAHATQDITTIIKRYRASSEIENDANNENLPPIPVQSNNLLGSPYENVRSGDELYLQKELSPTQWQLYHKPRNENRRVCVNSAISLGSGNGQYQMPPKLRMLIDTNGCYTLEDQKSLTLHVGCYGDRESDQLSVSSPSSIGGPSPLERHCLPLDSLASGIYLPMAPLFSSLHTPASSSKVSPTPPKKPPRRNLSVSPTHLQTEMSLSVSSQVDRKDYDYLFLAHSSPCKWIELESPQEHNKSLRCIHHSANQYINMKSCQEQLNDEVHIKPSEAEIEPMSLICIHENMPKTTNPHRKLRNHICECATYENFEIGTSPGNDKSPFSENGITSIQEKTFYSNASLTLKTFEEGLLEDQRNGSSELQQEIYNKRLKKVQMLLPTSPTHYVQPPTPDHPPPTALQAEKSIHERMRPFSEVHKRRSRDMETEIDENLLQIPAISSLNASSGSLSSVSLSDKNLSTDNVEEYFGDVPFAGLLKGSILVAERPRTLRRLRKFYSPAVGDNDSGMGIGPIISSEQQFNQQDISTTVETSNRRLSADQEQCNDKILSIMSPFNEQEEWAKISEIMSSFGTGLVRESVFVVELEKEFQTRFGLCADPASSCMLTLVGQWLSKLQLADHESVFINYGFDDLEFINGILDESDLKDMNINNGQERSIILKAVTLLNNCVEKQFTSKKNQTVDEWLKSIHLDSYAELFKRHLYTDMDRVRRVWEVELAAVLEIQKPAHRKRILISVSGCYTQQSSLHVQNGNDLNLEDLNKDLNVLKTNIQQLKEEICDKLPGSIEDNTNGLSTSTTAMTDTNFSLISTLKYRKNRPAPQPPLNPSINGVVQASDHLEIRGPSELFFGVPSTLKTQWRHQPTDLVTGCVTYIANYLGSTVVKELKGTESTKKSIQKLKKISRDPKGTPDITLSISYRGVRFLNTFTNKPICEHEIRNIHCACQDADDLTHFAYITKDHASQIHFCHVFCVTTMDQATEIILTLGQAFEVAYQIALKDKYGSHAIHSQSTNQLISLLSSTSNCPTTMKVLDSCIKELSENDYHNNELNSHNKNHNDLRSNNAQSKSTITAFNTTAFCTTNIVLNTRQKQQQNICHVSNPNKSFKNSNSHPTSTNLNLNENSTTIDHSIAVKFLTTHGRSHSVNDIKINGNELKLIQTQVDDIGIGVKSMKSGCRAPIALSEEL